MNIVQNHPEHDIEILQVLQLQLVLLLEQPLEQLGGLELQLEQLQGLQLEQQQGLQLEQQQGLLLEQLQIPQVVQQLEQPAQLGQFEHK